MFVGGVVLVWLLVDLFGCWFDIVVVWLWVEVVFVNVDLICV